MFVWYSKGTEESGIKIAEKLGCDHGTVPPKGYEGDVYCFGAAPAANFKWGDRKFDKVYNDPRVFRNRRTATELTGLGLDIAKNVRIFCSGKKIVKVVDTGSKQAIGFTEAVRTQVTTKLLSKLGEPGLIALDGVLTSNGFVLSNVVYGPSLLEHDDVVSSLSDSVGFDAKKELDDLVKAASPEEARSIMSVLRKMAVG